MINFILQVIFYFLVAVFMAGIVIGAIVARSLEWMWNWIFNPVYVPPTPEPPAPVEEKDPPVEIKTFVAEDEMQTRKN